MKKYFLVFTTMVLLLVGNSCSERDLELFPPDLDGIGSTDTAPKLQMLLNGAYLSLSNVDVYGTKAMVFGDIMGDKLFINTNPSFLDTFNFNFNQTQQGDFNGFYHGLYSVIAKCNLVINNSIVPNEGDVTRMKGEAKILRALAYFTLVNYYSPTPTSGVNQEYGVPIVLGDYDVNLQQPRATVAQVYDQIIADLMDGLQHGQAAPNSKVILGKTAVKLLLSKVYLTRRAAGDAQLALQYATEVKNEGAANPDTFVTGGPVDLAKYTSYFAGTNDSVAEDQPETIWELDVNNNTRAVTGIGANIAIPAYYNRIDSKKCILFTKSFYDSFKTTDVRRGAATTGLLINVGVPTQDDPRGFWTNKYPRLTSDGNYNRNIKIFRYSDAALSRIEALHLLGQDALALTELNAFATSRNGKTYTGANLLQDILEERSKEFYGEGQRFLDLKRYNLPVQRVSNCNVTCSVAANDKLFVLPVSQGALNSNANLTQYPGY